MKFFTAIALVLMPVASTSTVVTYPDCPVENSDFRDCAGCCSMKKDEYNILCGGDMECASYLKGICETMCTVLPYFSYPNCAVEGDCMSCCTERYEEYNNWIGRNTDAKNENEIVFNECKNTCVTNAIDVSYPDCSAETDYVSRCKGCCAAKENEYGNLCGTDTQCHALNEGYNKECEHRCEDECLLVCSEALIDCKAGCSDGNDRMLRRLPQGLVSEIDACENQCFADVEACGNSCTSQ